MGAVAVAQSPQPSRRRLRDLCIVLAIACGTFGLIRGATSISRPSAPTTDFDRLPTRSRLGTMTVEKSVIDLGTLRAHDLIGRSQNFVLRNTSSKPWRITTTSASCGCMTTKPPETEVAPSETVTLPLKLDWSNRMGPQSGTLRVSNSVGDQITVGVTGIVTQFAALNPTDMIITAEGTRTRERPLEILVDGEGSRLVNVLDLPPGLHVLNAQGEPLTFPITIDDRRTPFRGLRIVLRKTLNDPSSWVGNPRFVVHTSTGTVELKLPLLR